MKKSEKREVAVIIGIIALFILISIGLKVLHRFDYGDHLDEAMITVDGQPITLREFGYYIFEVETYIQKQALAYDPADPEHWWHIHFDSGGDSGFMSDYAKTLATNLCIADEIYCHEAVRRGMTLETGEQDAAIKDASDLIDHMDPEQISATGLSKNMILDISKKHALAAKYASWLADNADLTAYPGEPGKLVDWDGAYYQQVILPGHSVLTNDRVLDRITLGTITVN